MNGAVCGYVVHRQTLEPVSGARVVARLSEGFSSDVETSNETQSLETTAVTDAYGRFAFDHLAEARWLFNVYTPQGQVVGQATVRVFGDSMSDVTIEADDQSACDVDSSNNIPQEAIRMRPYGSVRGKVIHAQTAQPVKDAAVFVLEAAGIAPDIAPLTDADGIFFLDSLPGGEWRFGVHGPNGESGSGSIEVRDGATGEMTIKVT
jgi:hypothetical protein